MHEILSKSQALAKELSVFRIDEDKRIEVKKKIFKYIEHTEKIIAEFIKLFSVVYDESLKQLYDNIYMKFNALDIQVKLFNLRYEEKYIKNSLALCKNLQNIFETLEMHQQKEKKEEDKQSDIQDNYQAASKADESPDSVKNYSYSKNI